MKVDGTKSFPLRKGSLFYLNQGVHHHLVSNLDDQMEAILVPFTYTPIVFADKIPPQWAEDERKLLTYLDNNRYLQADDEFGCGSELQNLIEFTKVSHRGEYVKIKNYISNFMLSALQAFAGTPQRLDFMNILENSPTFHATDKYMRRHYTENISLQSMAEELHYSPRQCQRLLYDSMGMSFSELLLDMRMTHARELLRSTDETMEEIAEHSGFRSSKAFSRQFREKEGTTPSAYRKSFRHSPSSQS
jgi:AraC-like DNA-binding protein